MRKEVRIVEYHNGGGGGGGEGVGGGEYDDRVLEWQDGLPGLDDLTPLSQALIPPELAAAFRITAEAPRTVVEVNRASNNTISSIRGQLSAFGEANNHDFGNNNFKSFGEEEEFVENEDAQVDLNLEGMNSRKVRRIEAVVEESDSVMKTDYNNNNTNNNNTNTNNNYSVSNMSASNDDLGSSKTSKRPRLVWTPQLHKRFVDVVAHLGIKNAVPKTIMQLMNVEGLTRENVASHLQKYRLYLKRMQGLSDEGPSASDHLFASTPVPQSLEESGGGGGGGGGTVAGHGNGHNRQPQHQSSGNGHSGMAIPYPPPQSQMMHMPFIRMPTHGHGHVGVPPGNGYHGYEAHHPYTMMQNKFVPFPQYHNHVAPSDN